MRARTVRRGPAATSYTTTFQSVENPVSEGGGWVNGADSNSTVVRVSSAGKCHGTQAGTPPPYDDSQMWLAANYADNQEVEITVALSDSGGANKEVEILLWAGNVAEFTATFGQSKTDLFELNWHNGGSYLILGRYKMEEIDRIASPPAPSNGDRLRLRITKNGANVEFRCWINDVAKNWNGSGTAVVTYTGNQSHPTGNPFPLGRRPGIGFYVDGGASNSAFWATAFTAREA